MTDPLLPHLRPAAATPGRMLGRCAVLERIADGAQGSVYRGFHLDLRIPVAVKVMHAAFAGRPEHRERFLLEAQACARVQHRNVVRIYQVGSHHGVPFLVTELVRGVDLTELLARYRRQTGRVGLPDADAIAIAAQVAAGLGALHRARLVHRDVKPRNVLVRPDGRTKLSDLGLVRQMDDPGRTLLGDVLGTLPYVAPEQVRDPRSAGPAADIHGLGMTMFFLLTGEDPWAILRGTLEPRSLTELMQRVVCTEDLDRRLLAAGVGPDLRAVVARCVLEAPDARYADGEALHRDLLAVMAKLPERGRVPGVLARPTFAADGFGEARDLLALDRLQAAPRETARPTLPPADEDPDRVGTAVLLLQARTATAPAVSGPLPRLPAGFAVAAGAELDAERRPLAIVEPCTGMVLRLVALPGGSAVYFGERPVDQRQWHAVMGTRPGRTRGDDLPVESIDWSEAREFCRRIGGRLPRDAEWTAGIAALGEAADPAREQVWEWCLDEWRGGPGATGSRRMRVVRGASWLSQGGGGGPARSARAANLHAPFVGVRLLVPAPGSLARLRP